jgi:hypothetical protein
VIRVRVVADAVDELHAAADAVGQVLDIHEASAPYPRRTGGVSLYLTASLPASARTTGPEPGAGGRRD